MPQVLAAVGPIASAVAGGLGTAGSAIATGASALGSGLLSAITTGAQAVGSGLMSGAQTVGSGIASGADTISSWLGSAGGATTTPAAQFLGPGVTPSPFPSLDEMINGGVTRPMAGLGGQPFMPQKDTDPFWDDFKGFMKGAGLEALKGAGSGMADAYRAQTAPRVGQFVPGGGGGVGASGPLRTGADEGILALISSGRRGGGMRLG